MKKLLEKISKSLNLKSIDQGFIMMKISEIQIHKNIANLFHVKPELVDKIADSMLKHGYDKSQPIVIGKIKDIGEYLVDGHTRLESSKKAKLEELPIIYRNFDTLEDAQHYTYARQAERRNLTDKEILEVARLLPKKSIRDGSGRSVENLSKELGVSASTLVHARSVAEKASDEVLAEIKEGKTTINKAYQKIKGSKAKTKDNEQKNGHISITLPKEDCARPFFKGNEESSTEIMEIKEEEQTKHDKIDSCINSPEADDNSLIYEKDNEIASGILEINEDIIISIDDVLRLLMDNKEIKAVNLIISKYRNSVSDKLLLELNL